MPTKKQINDLISADFFFKKETGNSIFDNDEQSVRGSRPKNNKKLPEFKGEKLGQLFKNPETGEIKLLHKKCDNYKNCNNYCDNNDNLCYNCK